MISRIVAKAMELGASAAGITPVSDLKRAPSYPAYHQDPYEEGYWGVEWPEDARSLLVFALEHPRGEPDLDWWGPIPGGTMGNRELIRIASEMKRWFQQETEVKAAPLAYNIENGGVFLKDAAVLAGLGVIGRNNLLITPGFGPSVRLRAMFLDVALASAGHMEFDPCEGCPAPCLRACPEKAFDNGRYDRDLCEVQMNKNRANRSIVTNRELDNMSYQVIKSCRACEFACPAGRADAM